MIDLPDDQAHHSAPGYPCPPVAQRHAETAYRDAAMPLLLKVGLAIALCGLLTLVVSVTFLPIGDQHLEQHAPAGLEGRNR